MIPGMNPRKMQGMMKKMGIAQEEINATEVIIKTPDSQIIIQNPQVSKVKMMGQETFQIAGEAHVQELSTEPDINEDDVQTVAEQAKVDEETARNAIKEHKGDLAEAILELQNK